MDAPIGIGAAFAAGIVSFLSPCVLPLVPGYISMISGLSLQELADEGESRAAARRAGLGSIAFVLGFSFVFTALGASASFIGSLLSAHMGLLSKAAGVVIIVFGLHVTGLVPIKWLYYEKRFQAGEARGLAGSFLMGLAFAFGWTPCIGPILASILALAATQETIRQGVVLLMIYSLGLGLPFIATGFGVSAFMRVFARYKPFIRWGEIAAGVLLIAVSALVLTNRLTALVGLLPAGLRRFAL